MATEDISTGKFVPYLGREVRKTKSKDKPEFVINERRPNSRAGRFTKSFKRLKDAEEYAKGKARNRPGFVYHIAEFRPICNLVEVPSISRKQKT